MNMTSNSVIFTQNISRFGSMFCLASENRNVFSTAVIKSKGFSVTTTTSLSVSVVLIDLMPETFYFLFCYTEDFSGQGMDLNEVMQASANLTTECCRSLNFIQTVPSISQFDPSVTSVSAPVLFSFALSSPTTSNCTIRLASSLGDVSFLPSSTFNFIGYSSSLSRSFQIKALRPGTAKITVYSSSCKNSIVNGSMSLTVQSIGDPPPGPQLETARMSDNGK
jgi:hypothetical protein